MLDSAENADPNLSPEAQVLRDAKNLEPKRYVKVFTVDASGGDESFKTLKEAFAAVAVDKANALGQPRFVEAQSVPWLWHKVEVRPGDYHEALTVPPHTAVVGLGHRPEDVRIHWDGGENVVETSGRSLYMRNLLLEHTSDDDQAHPMRESGPSGDVGLKRAQRRTAVFESVHFKSARTAPLGKCTNDMAPYGMSLAFVNCLFDGPGQPQSVNLVTDATDEMDGAVDTSFIGCKVISNHEQHEDAKLGAKPGPAAPFGAPDSGKGRPDKVLWMSGSWDVTGVYGMQGLIVLPLVALSGKSDGAKAGTLYALVNPGSVKGMRTVKADQKSRITHSVPPGYRLPVHAFGMSERKFFGKMPTRDLGPVDILGQPTGTMHVRAGDIYWVRFNLRDTSLSVTGVQVPNLSAGSAAGAIALNEGSGPILDGNGWTGGSAGKSGARQSTLDRRWIFPGQGPFWVGVAFTKDAQVPSVRAPRGGGKRGMGYSSGPLQPGTLNEVGAGESVPAVQLISGLPEAFPR